MNIHQVDVVKPKGFFYANEEGADVPEETDPKPKDYVTEGESDDAATTEPASTDPAPLPPGF